jgi:hypothetical protein
MWMTESAISEADLFPARDAHLDGLAVRISLEPSPRESFDITTGGCESESPWLSFRRGRVEYDRRLAAERDGRQLSRRHALHEIRLGRHPKPATSRSRYARLVFERCGGNKRQASRLLDISYHTLDAYLRYGNTGSRPAGKQVPAWARAETCEPAVSMESPRS